MPRPVVSGHADRVGSEALNRRLARARAEAVKAYLERNGILAARIELEAWGEDRPLLETADGVEEAQNRYVIISAGTD